MAHGVRTALTRALRLPPLLLAAVLILPLSGCMSWQLARIAPWLPDTGAHRITFRHSGDTARYRLVSFLPPGDEGHDCDTVLHTERALTLLGCGDAHGYHNSDLPGLAASFQQAAAALDDYFEGVGLAALRVVLVPPGIGHLNDYRHRSPLTGMEWQMAFRYVPGDPASKRKAVRSFAHEYAHAGVRVRGDTDLDEEERLASLSASCVEYSAFGSTRGYSSPDDLHAFVPPTFNAAQRRSIEGFVGAYETIRPFMSDDAVIEAPAPAFEAFCAHSLGHRETAADAVPVEQIAPRDQSAERSAVNSAVMDN